MIDWPSTSTLIEIWGLPAVFQLKKLNSGGKSGFGLVKLLLCSIYGERGWGEKVGFPKERKGCFLITCRHWLICTRGSITQFLFLQSHCDFSCLSLGFWPQFHLETWLWSQHFVLLSLPCSAEALRPNCCVTNYQDKYLALISCLIMPFNRSSPQRAHGFLLCLHPLNAPFLLELSLVKMSKFSH